MSAHRLHSLAICTVECSLPEEMTLAEYRRDRVPSKRTHRHPDRPRTRLGLRRR
jgi:hypothetical protein